MTLLEPDTNSTHPFYSSIGLGYESISSSRNVLFQSGYNKKQWAGSIDGIYRKNENYKDGNGIIIPFSQFEKTNVHSALKYTLDESNSFKADILFDEARNVGYPALPMDVALARAYLFALEYQHFGKIRIKAKMYFNSVYHLMDDSKRDSTFLLEDKLTGTKDTVYMRMDMPGNSKTLGAYFQAESFWNNKNKITWKFENYTNHSIAEMTMHMNRPETGPEPAMYMQTWPEMLRNVTGLFVQNTTYFEPFVFTANARVDYNVDILQSEYGQEQFSIFGYSLDKTQSKFVGSLNASLQYQITDAVQLAATIGYSDRLPTITERLGFYLYNAYDGYDYIGNPYIKPEKSNFYSLGFRVTKNKLKINLSQSLSFVKDYIMGVTDSLIPPMNFYTNGTRVYSNINGANLYSTDMQVLYTPVESVSLFLLSKFTIGELHSGDPLPLVPPLKNIAAAKYSKNGFSFQAECEFALAQNRINTNYGEYKTPGYSVYNLKSGYSFRLSETLVDIGFSITNLFNKVYYEHLDWGRINRPGRSFELFVKFSY
jgi:iron complex outermembrane recepter protein